MYISKTYQKILHLEMKKKYGTVILLLFFILQL